MAATTRALLTSERIRSEAEANPRNVWALISEVDTSTRVGTRRWTAAIVGGWNARKKSDKSCSFSGTPVNVVSKS